MSELNNNPMFESVDPRMAYFERQARIKATIFNRLHDIVAQEAEQPKAVFPEPIPEIPETRPERSIKV